MSPIPDKILPNQNPLLENVPCPDCPYCGKTMGCAVYTFWDKGEHFCVLSWYCNCDDVQMLEQKFQIDKLNEQEDEQ